MKTLYYLSFLALIMITSTVAAQPEATIHLVSGDAAPTVDGDITDWDGIEKNTIENFLWDNEVTDNTATWSAVWTIDSLYVMIEVVDDVLAVSGKIGGVREGDRIDFVFSNNDKKESGWAINDNGDPYGSGAELDVFGQQFRYTTDGSKFTEGEMEGLVGSPLHYIINETGTGYIFEIALPWTPFGMELIDLKRVIWEIVIVDYDDEGDYMFNQLTWATTENVWLSMANAGYVTLSTAPPTAIEMNAIDNRSIHVYPNPTTQYIEIVFGKTIQNVKLYSIMGQEVRNVSVANNNHVTLDLEDVSSGVYLLQAETEEGVFCKRIVKK